MTSGSVSTSRRLVVLGCSATKVETDGVLPAIALYDGPMFRVLRSFLRDNRWPNSLSVAVLSAKFGLIGGLAHIPHYNERMTASRAGELNASVTASMQKLAADHRTIELVMGRDYLGSIDLDAVRSSRRSLNFAEGGIGVKLNHLHNLLRSIPHERRVERDTSDLPKRPLYFLPDWDDFVDVDFDFKNDKFSSDKRASRREEHSIALMRPQRLCDGVLVSLAQHLGGKGLLRRIEHTNAESLSPRSVRTHFKLHQDQWAFGDCGAFSYVNEEQPTISVEQAVSVYDLYEFDFGASVDHIPILEIERDGKKQKLTLSERKERIELTKANAEKFLNLHRQAHAQFTPVGVVQGLTAKDFADCVAEYVDMGYAHIALGGLVPRSDSDISEIVKAVHARVSKMSTAPWLHLLGVFRPALQQEFRTSGIHSFDSATYFRKSWLRSDQNYLATDGQWYAAIRVPPTSDPRTLARLKTSGLAEKRIKQLEKNALEALHSFDCGGTSLDKCVKAISAYDALLPRAKTEDVSDKYRKTLKAKPWKQCSCSVCREIGIDVVVFRGLNRNKRRGAHNTLRLYQTLKEVGTPKSRSN